jgi:hypothetical protein
MRTLGKFVGTDKVGLIWDGNVSLLTSLYKDTTTKRRFRFYGIAIGWVMIGVTIASTHSLARGPEEAP